MSPEHKPEGLAEAVLYCSLMSFDMGPFSTLSYFFFIDILKGGTQMSPERQERRENNNNNIVMLL